MSPITGSTSSPSILARLAVARIRTFTRTPRAKALRATAAPTKPEAPVTRTVSAIGGPGLSGGQPGAPFHHLPINQRGYPDHDLTGSLEQRHRQTQFGRQPEQRRQ